MQKVRYVPNGTETWEGVDPLPRRRKLDREQELELFNMVRKGFGNKDIAKKFGIAPDTVGVYYRRTLRERGKEQERKESRFRVVAQRRVGQELTFSVDDGYVGRTTVGGVEETCAFRAKDDTDAIGKFDKWLADMDAEQSFMDMVERKPVIDSDEGDGKPGSGLMMPVPPFAHLTGELDGKRAVCGAPLDPIEEIRPAAEVAIPSDERIREAIHEAQQEFDANTTKHMEATGVPLADTSEPAYLIWAKQPEPRCYGLYLTMEDALAEVDKLNDVARFLGNSGAFEVEEVTWKV